MSSNFRATKPFLWEIQFQICSPKEILNVDAGFGAWIICLMLETGSLWSLLAGLQPTPMPPLSLSLSRHGWFYIIQLSFNIFLTISPAGKFLRGCTCRGRSCVAQLWTLIHLIHLFSCFSYHQLHRKLTKIYWLFACPGLLCKKDHHRKIFCSNQIFLKEMRCGTLWYRDARPAPRKLIFAVLICGNICREVMHFSE